MSITVRSGDTLWGLAQQYGTTVDDLIAANPDIGDPDLIYPGEELNLPGWNGQDSFDPGPVSQDPGPAQSQGATYTVQPGDTLSAIGARFGVSYQAIADANGIADPDFIEVGQELQIPGAGQPQPSPAPDPAPAPQSTTYTVQPGDTLSAIGARFGVSYQSIAAANGIANPNFIYAGQTLTIPGADGSPEPQPVQGAQGLNVDKMPAQYRQWVPYVENAAAQTGLPPSLIFAVMSKETNGYNVIGDFGHGRGLMQIDDRSWGGWLLANNGGMDPATNILKGAQILRSSIDAFGGNVFEGVAAYNAGVGGVQHALANGWSADAATTGGNYASDALSRQSWFV